MIAFAFVKNFSLGSGDHLMIGLRLYSPDYKHANIWYTHPILSKFLYIRNSAGSCNLYFTIDDSEVYFPVIRNAKLAFLLDILSVEYDEERGWNKETDREFLKWSIEAALSDCDPNSNPQYLGNLNYVFPPLVSAVASQQEDIVQLLIDAGADPNFRIDRPGHKMHGLTILEIAYRLRNHTKSDDDKDVLDRILGILQSRK
jgi:ankyrin repeat protein